VDANRAAGEAAAPVAKAGVEAEARAFRPSMRAVPAWSPKWIRRST